MAKTEVLGIGDMRAGFERVREDMRKRTSRRMLVAAGGVLKGKAKVIALANGSRRTGAMIKNIAIKRETSAPAGTEQYHLGVRHGRNLTAKAKKSGAHLAVSKKGRIVKRYEDDRYYWRWVELGHKVVGRATGRAGQQELTYTRKGRSGNLITYKRKRSADSLRARRAQASESVAAKPFIAPALEQGRGDAHKAMESKLQQDLEKAGKA